MFYARLYPQGVLAFADEELMGQSFQEGEFLLSVTGFFGTELVGEDRLEQLLPKARTVNAVGERAVRFLIDRGLCTERGVKRVAGVPHVQLFFIEL